MPATEIYKVVSSKGVIARRAVGRSTFTRFAEMAPNITYKRKEIAKSVAGHTGRRGWGGGGGG